jgi:hypothetical protein
VDKDSIGIDPGETAGVSADLASVSVEIEEPYNPRDSDVVSTLFKGRGSLESDSSLFDGRAATSVAKARASLHNTDRSSSV